MAHEDQFTATGPAFEGGRICENGVFDGQRGYGFDIWSKRSRFGCGVYGEIGGSSTNREAEIRAGVCGVGHDYGVFGKGLTEAGVRALTR